MEEIRGYGKVRRIKYGASIRIHGDNKNTYEKEQVWKYIRGKVWKSMKEYGESRTRCHGRWMYCARQEKREGGTLS